MDHNLVDFYEIKDEKQSISLVENLTKMDTRSQIGVLLKEKQLTKFRKRIYETTYIPSTDNQY